LLALLFPLGPELYALPLAQVREVVPAPALTCLPTAPPFVLGLVSLRGDVLPVLDSGMLLGSPFPADPRYVLVVDAWGSPIGLAVGGLPRIAELGPGAGPGPDVRTVDGEPVVLTDASVLVGRPQGEG
jgi:purine-binding chemotaxis protein CheW